MTEEKKNEEMVFNPTFIEETQDVKTEEPVKDELNLFNDTSLEPAKSETDLVIEGDATKETDIKDKTPLSEETKDSSLFSVVLGQDLMKGGVLSEFDEAEIKKISEEEGEDVAIRTMISKQIEASESSLKENYDKNYQDYLTLIQGGVPQSEALEINQIEGFSKQMDSIDLTGEDDISVQSRKDVLTLNYRLTTKWSEDRIQRYVNGVYENGSDLEEIDEAKENIANYVEEVKSAQVKKAESDRKAIIDGQEKFKTDLKGFVNKTEEYFEGDAVNKETKSKMIKALLDPVKTSNGNITNQIWAKRDENSIEFDSKIAYLYSIGYFDGKPLDKFMKSAQTKATSNLQNFIASNKGRSLTGSKDRSFSSNKAGDSDPFSQFLK